MVDNVGTLNNVPKDIHVLLPRAYLWMLPYMSKRDIADVIKYLEIKRLFLIVQMDSKYKL